MIPNIHPSAGAERPAEINRMLQAAKYGYIVLSLLICALGIAGIAQPDFPVYRFCWISGILLIAFGWVKLLGYLSKDLYRLAFQHDLAFGILLNILGIILILHNDAILHLTGAVLGVFILSDALLKIQISLDARTFGLPYWWAILVAAVAASVLSLLLLMKARAARETMMILLGASLLCEGILSLVTVLTAVEILQKKEPVNPEKGL